MSRVEQTIKISEIFFNRIKQLDQEERLDPQHLSQFKKQHFKLLYPHKEDVDGIRKFTCCQSCGQSPGYFCCCSSTRPQPDFIKFGLSICLYFKYIKHSTIFYAFMSLIAILSCFVCYQVALQNNIDPLQNYSNFLFSTTYGSFASQHNKCQYKIPVASQATFNLKCQSGQLNITELDQFHVSYSNQTLNSLYNCRNERKKQQESTGVQALSMKSRSCNSDNSQCTIVVNQLAVQSFVTLVYTYQCINNYYQIGKINQRSAYYLYLVVGVDVFICLCFIIFIRSQIGSENSEADFFKKYQLSLQDFSIKIKGFQTKTAEKEVQALLQALKQRFPQQIPKSIVSFTFTQNKKMLEIYQSKFKLFNKISDLIQKYYLSQRQNEKLSFKQCHEKVFNQQKEGLFNQYRQQFQKLINKIIEKEKYRTEIQLQSQDRVSLFLVFDTVTKKNYIRDLIVDRCCSSNYIRIANRYYQIEEAPNPDMMIWQNKFSWTTFRVFISWIVTLAVCVGSYLLFGYIQYKQNELFKNNDYGIDCNVLFPNGIIGNQLSAHYQTCRCSTQSLTSAISNTDCSNWSRQYILYKTVPLLISLGIVCYNIFVTFIFRIMSKLERHKTLIDEEVGFALKRAFLLILNMGLIMILLNYNYKNTSSLSQVSFAFFNRFDDFTSDWYQVIGVIVILTMVFNIATPITEFMLSFIIKCFRKCWDTRCCQRKTSMKTKSQYLQYFSDDVFPIGQRYAYLIATFFISFSFSGVIPILIPVSTIAFFLLYHSDKILIFKFYQTPVNYTQSLNRIMIRVLILSLISHLALTAYFLTEPTLIAASSSIPIPVQTILSRNSRINSMLITVYIYPYLGLLALVLIILILASFCGSLMTALYNCCCKRRGEEYEENNNQLSAMKKQTFFWNILSKLQLQNLLKVSQYSVQRYRSKMLGPKNLQSYMQQNVDLKKTQHVSYICESILQDGITRLQKPSNIDRRDTHLIGLPSYEYLIKSDKLTKNAQMMKIELQLKDFYKRKMLEEPIFHQMRLSVVANDASAAQLRVEN